MGVIRQPRKVIIANPNSNTNTDTDGATTGNNTEDEGSVVNAPRAAPVPSARPPASPSLARARLGHRLMLKQGRKCKQRYENERVLMAMYGIDSEQSLMGEDLAPETRSHFMDLLESENQDVLEQFLNNEEDKLFNKEKEVSKKKSYVEEQDFEAERAFMKIGFNMRAALKNQLPFGMLQGIENNINESFLNDPDFELIVEGYSSFERLLLHSLCAYNALNSYSFDIDGKRKVKVANPYPGFYKKDPSLHAYLLSKLKR